MFPLPSRSSQPLTPTARRLTRAAILGALLAAAPVLTSPFFPSPACASAGPKAATKTPPVQVSEAWVREAPPGASVMGGYALLTNTGKTPLVLIGAASPLFEEVQMHTIVHEQGREGMRQLRAIPLPPGGRFRFVPGGNHLMFMRPKQALKQGDMVPVTLDFGPAGRLTLKMPVKRPV